MKKFLVLCLALTLVLATFAGCGGGASSKNLKDGTYTAIYSDARAEAAHGWKDKLTIDVTDGAVTIVEFDSYSMEDNRKKSEDPDYGMTVEDNGTTPAIYFPELIASWDAAEGDPKKIEVVAGATDTSNSMQELMTAALELAAKGADTEVVLD